MSFSGDWSLGVDWEIGGLEETGWTKLVLGWEAQESWKREIYIRGNVVKRVPCVWVKLNKRWAYFQGTRNLEIQ